MQIMDQGTILRNIQKIAPKFCDNCGHKYMPEAFKILKVTDNTALVHLTCESCKNTYIINAFINQTGFGSQRVPVVVDLNDTEEIKKFANSAPVTENDAIDAYNFFNQNMDLGKVFSTNVASEADSTSTQE